MFMFSKLYVGEKDFSTEECRPTGFRACNARPESRGAARLSLGSAPACLLFHDVFEAEFFAGLLQTRYAIVPRLLEFGREQLGQEVDERQRTRVAVEWRSRAGVADECLACILYGWGHVRVRDQNNVSPARGRCCHEVRGVLLIAAEVEHDHGCAAVELHEGIDRFRVDAGQIERMSAQMM